MANVIRPAKYLVAGVFILAAGIAAWSQTSPNWYDGLVPTPAQWNTLFASKQDTISFGADVLNVLEIPIGSPGAMIVNGGATIIEPANGGTGLSTLTSGAPLLGNGTNPVTFGTVSGNTTAFLTRDGSFTSGNCPRFDASGGIVDSGSPCALGSTTGSGAVVLATGATLVAPNLGTPASGNAGNLTNIPMGNAIGTLLVADGGTGAITLTGPLFGNGTSAVTAGTISGSGTKVATVTGTPTNGDCASWSSGNVIDAGGPCTTGGGGGTVSTASSGQIAGYASTGTVVSGVNVTGSGSVVEATSPTLVTPALGTPSALNCANCTNVPFSAIASLGSGWSTPLAAALGSNWTAAFAATIASSVQGALATAVNVASGLLQLNGSGFIPAIDKVGVTAGTTPAAGNVGEVLSADVPVGSAVSIPTATSSTVTSKPLSAGAWMCSGNIQTVASATAVVSEVDAWVGTSTSLPTNLEQNGYTVSYSDGAVQDSPSPITGDVFFNFSSPTTVYLQVVGFFSHTMSVYGRLNCLRIR
jgi:hypothetical protein